MGKKKNHQKKGGIEVFYEENKPDFAKRTNFGGYSVKKTKKGFELDIYQERGIDKKLTFKDKAALDAYLKKNNF